MEIDAEFRRLAARGSFVMQTATRYASVRDDLPSDEEPRFRTVMVLTWWPKGYRGNIALGRCYTGASVTEVLAEALADTAPPRVSLSKLTRRYQLAG